jgi:hypothetical protein
VKFKKVNFKNDRWSIKIKDVTNIFENETQEYLALHIAKGINKNKYDLIIINSDVSYECDKLNEQITNAELIYDIINLTGHPVLYMPKWSKLKPWQNVLHPVNHFTYTVIEFDQMLPLIKMFDSKIHLLGIMNILNREVTKEYYNALYAVNNYYVKHRINVRSKLINHNVESDTIFAYASIIQADLIYNALTPNKLSGRGQIYSTWEKMIDRSEIPLYNYFC